jgi:3,4-dihydroxy 2-butanone 4-phosphate synthase
LQQNFYISYTCQTGRRKTTGKLERALADLREGKIVLVFDSDDREGETDMVFASEKVTQDHIRTLRKEAGGLICTTIHSDISESIGLPFLADVFSSVSDKYPVMGYLSPNDIPYDTKSAFSITINHRKTFTGIIDHDRSLTISEFTGLIKETMGQEDGWATEEMGKRFRAPGHVMLLNTTKDLLTKRQGHTELSTALMVMAGLIPSATICEMMGDDGNALSKEKAKEHAERYGLVFLEGDEVIEAWKRFKGE